MRRFARRLHTPLILRKTRDTPVTPLRFCSASTNNATSEVALNHGRNPLDLVDVLGGGERPPLERNCEATGAANLSKVTLRQIVRDVAATTGAHHNSDHGVGNYENDTGISGSSGLSGEANAGCAEESPYKVAIADRYGMPAELPPSAPQFFKDLAELCPSETLRRQLLELQRTRNWNDMTAVQRAAIPLALEHRDILCIAPTATGKTFGYLFPSMLRLAMYAGTDGSSNLTGSVSEDLNRPNIEKLMQDKMEKGEVCRYCELSVKEVRVCPLTGQPHPDPVPEDAAKQQRSPMWVSELSSVAEPLLLVLVPTSQLVMQVYHLCKKLDADFRVKFLVRASSAEEQRRHLNALEGCDVLITTPETMLPALYKRKLSLKRVKVLVLDEVDDLLSTNHFEKVKIILGALPKGPQRPQRLLFGASLPPSVYQMIKEQMLLPSHRFVLVDVKTDKLGHPIAPAPGSICGAAVCASITHVVFMVSQAEKISRLAWLYSSGKLRKDQRTLIFCNSRHNVAYVCERLQNLVPGLRVTTLTSHSSATGKTGTMKLFSKGASTCLICTDILSRGIDFADVIYVVHYDVPTEFETWVHRSGRCGRRGLRGYCYTFFQPENVRLAKPLVAHLRQTQQLIPPKLQEYARQSLIDVFKTSLFYHPTRRYRPRDPQQQAPVLGRATPRFPDYKQDRLNKNFRPL
ncbi:ATP-dependent DEAD/H RNA helicase, putative [Trypanosoma brucei gambiense DAL972]|uniref:ATP-dependent RNA helicase n=1 Tax=Trypanosoma brucei gambiense (strain MHOM/CI/86/DAL972) TaxID=679716 RepID=D0A3C9_TRYB9|nr:ATP-dependent DEAD/H RNA helicase, putative [Trypanosoma brucei gambiense DAL972]CBH15773.1 ATP-dependent DEAD/H RNA helicase, putative [Trypanosoma brucei gambiense DAL972]|eukprot:XP_011778037.1 ATP-dependent DEAD/H RNA helicase, putative [Trypanosoma brucei gambiense DAL972]